MTTELKFKNRSEVNPKIVLEKDQSFIGEYVGTKECTSKKKKKGVFEKFNVHQFQLDGLTQDLMGCGGLDFQILGKSKKGDKDIEPIEIGTVCKISYFGKKSVDIDGTSQSINDYNVATAE